MQSIFHSLMIFAAIGLFIPAYAQNISNDEVDIKIREEVAKCRGEIDADESLTEAEKTVAKRKCETEITNNYKNVENDHKDLAEQKAKLNNIQKCIDWYPQFRYLTEQQFRVQKNVQAVNNCIRLYQDSIWQYDGPDRLEKLVDRLDEMKKERADSLSSTSLTDSPSQQSNIVEIEQNQDQVSELKTKIKTLEEEIAKKDQIIREQMKVIMDLANRLKNVLFEPLHTFLTQL